MLERPSCNICNLDNCEILVKDGLSNIVRCRNCGLVYRNPRESQEESLNNYKHSYWTPLKKEFWYKRRMIFFERILKKIEKIRPKGRLLDLGCGFGYFLDLAKKRGWQVYGVEPSNSASQFAMQEFKLNISQGELEDAQFASNSFDVITMWNVLEHLHDPLALLREANRILKKDGLVVMRVPNMDFQLPGFRFFKKIEKIANIFGIDNQFVIHKYSFSNDTLKIILEMAGFKNIQVVNSELRSKPVAFINHIFFNLAQLLFYLTKGKVFIAPTLEAYASR